MHDIALIYNFDEVLTLFFMKKCKSFSKLMQRILNIIYDFKNRAPALKLSVLTCAVFVQLKDFEGQQPQQQQH